MSDPGPALATVLAPHYSHFRVAERTLLTGHSHQAWPDAGFHGQQRAWLDAAAFVDAKWERAEQQAATVKRGFARLLGDRPANIALGTNTHELLTRWLSALPLAARRRIVTTDGEFHTARRQLARLAEEGIDIVHVTARPVDALAERLAAAVTDRTAAVVVSSVLFETAEIVPGLSRVADACRTHGASLLVDAYHHLNVVEFDVSGLGLDDAFVTGGGYKYCQLGEGNCFLRVPPGTRMRPVLTGWFAESELETADRLAQHRGTSSGGASPESVPYAAGAGAFAGATYDPTSHYRAAEVYAFHERMALFPPRLRQVSGAQVRLLEQSIASLDLPATRLQVVQVPAERRGGFLAIRTPHAAAFVLGLRARGVFADARGAILRLGPAPYVSDEQLRDAARALEDCVRDLA